MPDTLNHEHVLESISNIFVKAQKDGLAPVCLAIFSPSGHMIHLARMTGAPDRAVNIALAKAKTAALMGASTRVLHTRLLKERLHHEDFCGAVLTTIVGGVPLYKGEVLYGGLGVSGRSPDKDEKLAQDCARLLLA